MADADRHDLRVLWAAVTGFFALALFVTGMAGPFWALWAWTLAALPLWVVSTRGRRTVRVAGVIATLAVSVGIILVIRRFEAGGGGVPEPLGTIFLITIFAWPPVLALLAVRLLRDRLGQQASR